MNSNIELLDSSRIFLTNEYDYICYFLSLFILSIFWIQISKPKTSYLTSKLSKMQIDSALFIDGVDIERNFKHAVRNIPKTDFLPISGINVYDIIRRNFLVISEKALLGINERFRNE